MLTGIRREGPKLGSYTCENILEESRFTQDKKPKNRNLIIRLFISYVTIFKNFDVTFSSCVEDTEYKKVFRFVHLLCFHKSQF